MPTFAGVFVPFIDYSSPQTRHHLWWQQYAKKALAVTAKAVVSVYVHGHRLA